MRLVNSVSPAQTRPLAASMSVLHQASLSSSLSLPVEKRTDLELMRRYERSAATPVVERVAAAAKLEGVKSGGDRVLSQVLR